MYKLKHQKIDLQVWNPHADLLFSSIKQAEFECLELITAHPNQPVNILNGDILCTTNNAILKMICESKKL